MIGDRLRLCRENFEKNQSYMAKYLNIARTTYTDYELNESTPPIERLCDLAIFYNVSLDYILGLNKNKKPYGKMSKFNRQTFKKNIKSVRKFLHYTQKELATLIPCHQATITRYENGQTNIQLDFLVKLSNLTNIPTDYIVGIISK